MYSIDYSLATSFILFLFPFKQVIDIGSDNDYSLPTTVLGEMANTALNEGFYLKPDVTEKRNIELEIKVMDWVSDLLQLPD